MRPDPQRPFRDIDPVSVQVQSVLYGTQPASIRRAFDSLSRAAELAIHEGVVRSVAWRIGDASPLMSSREIVESLNDREATASVAVEYDWFNENLGSARGHNRLAEGSEADFLLIQNPDVVVSPRAFHGLLAPFLRAPVGMVEAKQLPIEHPKDYDPVTGETSWATTACAMIPRPLFEYLNGFDAKSFFMYCDDLDFSWRVRLEGFRVIFQAGAVVFHDKRVSDTGAWKPSSAEVYYSAEAALFLAHKWSRPDIVGEISSYFADAPDENLRRALDTFERARVEGLLPVPLDADHKVAEFVAGNYTKHRFAL